MDKEDLAKYLYGFKAGLLAGLLPQIPSAKFDGKEFGVSFIAREPSDNNDKMGQAD